jgi:3-oxoacyl-[acyl-carrier protein] reductase
MTTIDLSGKIALITGSTGQLGRVMARTLAAGGADIALHYLKNEEKARELALEIAAMGRRAVAVQADVTDEASVNAMKETVERSLGLPDIVVNNAVSQYRWTSILDQPIGDFEDQFGTCVKSNVLMAKAFLPKMMERGEGRFIGINTECSALCNPASGAYASAKRGMDGIYRVLAKEVGESGVTVNQVAPGWTISDNDRERGTQIAPEYSAKVPLKRRGTDREIANAVLFFASELSSFITGVYLPVCGGTVIPGI